MIDHMEKLVPCIGWARVPNRGFPAQLICKNDNGLRIYPTTRNEKVWRWGYV